MACGALCGGPSRRAGFWRQRAGLWRRDRAGPWPQNRAGPWRHNSEKWEALLEVQADSALCYKDALLEFHKG